MDKNRYPLEVLVVLRDFGKQLVLHLVDTLTALRCDALGQFAKRFVTTHKAGPFFLSTFESVQSLVLIHRQHHHSRLAAAGNQLAFVVKESIPLRPV